MSAQSATSLLLMASVRPSVTCAANGMKALVNVQTAIKATTWYVESANKPIFFLSVLLIVSVQNGMGANVLNVPKGHTLAPLACVSLSVISVELGTNLMVSVCHAMQDMISKKENA